MMRLAGVLIASASWALLLVLWLVCGVPHGHGDLAACVFNNWLFGLAVPAAGYFLAREDA